MTEELLGISECAKLIGKSEKTWRHKLFTDQRARNEGDTSDRLFPLPDYRVSGTPIWKRETVVSWAKSTSWRGLARPASLEDSRV